jgi:GNAT superfamily N-acetyltransferase
MTQQVREARAEDWPGVARLLAELGRPAPSPGEEEAFRDVFVAYLGRNDAIALVAVEDDEIVGFLDLEFRRRINFIAEQAWIPDLVVTERRRSAGVGRALLSEAERIARERGCWGMSLESATWRERAHAFYIREGWSDTGKAFNKLLGAITWPPAPR